MVVPVSYRINVNSYLKASGIEYGNFYNATVFVYTNKNLNPEFNSPDLEVGNTSINGSLLNTRYDSNVLVSPDWIWDNKVADINLFTPPGAKFN